MLGQSYVSAVLEDASKAPIDEKLKSTLHFLEKLTLTPEAVGAEDIQPMKEAGVSEQAIEDAIHICALFNIIDRIADSLEFQVPGPKDFSRGATILLKRGYV